MAHINSGVIAISQTPNDDEVPEDARRQRLLLGRRRLGAAARAHPDARQVATATSCARARRGSRPASRSTTWPSTRSTSGSPPRTCPTRTTASPSTAQGTHPPGQDLPQRGAAPAAARASSRACSATSAATSARSRAASVLDQRIPLAGIAHQCGTVRFGDDPRDVGARRRLQGARPRQPLRRRHELLPLVERGEPGADGDGERAARRRPPARAARRSATAVHGTRHETPGGGGMSDASDTLADAHRQGPASPASPAPPR